MVPKVKHIAMRHYFLKENITARNITVEYIQSVENTADFMTKPLDGKLFFKHRQQLNLKRVLGL